MFVSIATTAGTPVWKSELWVMEHQRSLQEINSSCPRGLFRASASQQRRNTLRLPCRHFCIFNAASHRIWLLTFTSTSGQSSASSCSSPLIRRLRAFIPPSSGRQQDNRRVPSDRLHQHTSGLASSWVAGAGPGSGSSLLWVSIPT